MHGLVARVEGSAVSARPSPATPTLFRPEIMEEMRSQWLGSVLLEPKVSHRIFALGAGLAAVALALLLVFGSYTRKERVGGWLVPQLGIVRVATPQQAVVAEIKVREGEAVAAGTPLMVLSAEVQSEGAGPVREEVVKRLEAQRTSLINEKTTQQELFDQQSSDLSARVQALETERGHLAQEIKLQGERVRLSEKTLARLRPLRQQGWATEPQLEAAEQDRLDQATKLQTLQRAQADLAREVAELQGTLRQLPFNRAVKLQELDRESSTIEQQLAEAEGQRKTVIAAPQSGVVTNLRATVGSNVEANAPLLNIVPSGSVLHAELFGTSRSVGFIKPGQKVLLRYQAFPYQKFGFYSGTVASLSRSAMSPADLPQQLYGLTSLFGTNEPVYQIRVDLAKQTATVYGEPVLLQAGMQLDADIMIDRRRLIEWALDPLFSLTGGWQ